METGFYHISEETPKKNYPDIQIDHVQTNIEGEIIDALHKAGFIITASF